MKVAGDTRTLSDCHCENWWVFFPELKGGTCIGNVMWVMMQPIYNLSLFAM